MNVPKKFWRLRFSNELAFNEMIKTSSAVVPDAEFLEKVKCGHGLCLATYDHGTGCGNVKAVGIVTEVSKIAKTVQVTWKPAIFTVEPNPQGGQQQWSSRPYFCFEKDVASRYRFAEIFAKKFAIDSSKQ